MARWVRVLPADELPEDRPVTVRVNERDIALARRRGGGPPHAVDNRCPHRGGQLGDGSIRGDNIVCPLHGHDFDLGTGISRYDPANASERVAVYPTRIDNGQIQIDADAVPGLPGGHDSGYLARWARPRDDRDDRYHALKALGNSGRPAVSAMRSAKQLWPSWDDILLLPAQLSRLPLLADEGVSLETVIGRRAQRPLRIGVPFLISHMSFGALSASAKVALARVSAEVDTAIGTGEGGMLDEERAAAKYSIFEMASGYFGWNEKRIQSADAIEIKFGQSAKAGSGGLLPASKVTEPAEIRALLVEQVTQMVRWRESVEFLRDHGVDTLVELGPGKVLSGLTRRIDRDLQCSSDFLDVGPLQIRAGRQREQPGVHVFRNRKE